MIFANSEHELTRKLSLLELVYRITDLPTDKELTEHALMLECMNYFEIQHFIAQLLEDKYIEKIEHERQYYLKLTDDGYGLLVTLRDKIPFSWLETIQAITIPAKENKKESKIKRSSSISKIAESEFLVKLRLTEGERSLLSLDVVVFSASQAGAIVENWNVNTTHVYEKLMTTLV
jgi:hypothetical protein